MNKASLQKKIDLGHQFEVWLAYKEMTVAQLARKAGVSGSQAWRIVRNKRREPDFWAVLAMAKALTGSLHKLLYKQPPEE